MVHTTVDLADVEAHAKLLIDSYARLTGKSLIGGGRGAASEAEALFEAPYALLSHGTEADPILNFGNRQALTLWEMDWPSFTSMPSRLTAEPTLRADRTKLLEDVKRQGYSDGYRGIRIASSGKRFEIIDAVVWNVVDAEGVYRGQAAMFPLWGDARQADNY
ncbi:MEKHLA domain-containing protein [Cohnella sp. GCM10027633]|uniref:MEKHLA domain-containing protein n=1 Tax=unclassified Cohnella TaxID=2636738 RepID=UPI00362F112E